MIDKIVVGTDTEAAADLAVAQAAALTEFHDAELVVLYVQSPVDPRPIFTPNRLPDADVYLERLLERFPTVKMRVRRELGEPAEMLCAVAAEEAADVIVVGNRGVHGKQRWFLGSVANAVVRRSPCAVLVIDTRRAQ